MPLVDDELVTACARAPVDRANAVAGGEQPQVGELHPLALLPRDLVARVELRRDGSDDPAQRLGERVDAQPLLPVDAGLPDRQAEPVAGAEADVADLVVAPAGAAELQLERALVLPAEPERLRARAGHHLEPVRDDEDELEPLDRHLGGDRQLDVQLVVLERGRTLDVHLDADLRRAREPEAERQRQREGECEHGQLRPAQPERGEEEDRGEDGVRRHAGRRRGPHCAGLIPDDGVAGFGCRRRHGLEQLADDVLGGQLLHPELGPQHQPVGEARGRRPPSRPRA